MTVWLQTHLFHRTRWLVELLTTASACRAFIQIVASPIAPAHSPVLLGLGFGRSVKLCCTRLMKREIS
jgi:hypothetical protein